MRLLSIDNIKVDMTLARNIYSADGNVLLAEGVSLTVTYIEKLRELGIMSLYIVDNLVGRIEIDDLVKMQTRIEATKITKELMHSIHHNRTINGKKIHKIIGDVMDELLLNRSITFNLVEIRALNDYNFSHSLAVCILSLMTGITFGYNHSQLKELGTGALLHDVGKAAISDELLNKVEKLTSEEYAEIQKHAVIGYDTLKKCEDINSVAAHVAWQHHERFDGTGYPRGLKGKEIHEFSRIAALADVYDALSTDRIYRTRFLPHEVIEYIRDKGKHQFDPEITKIFLQNIAPFPIGSMVTLNSGEKGVVVKVAKDLPSRPVIRIIYDQDGQLLTDPVDRDLREDLTLFVNRVLKDNEN